VPKYKSRSDKAKEKMKKEESRGNPRVIMIIMHV
jgi:hypothetical protein